MTDKITQLRIGSKLIGLKGLDAALGEAPPGGWGAPEQALEEIYRRVAALNYIPGTCREEYRQALWREFRRRQGEELAPEAPAGLEIKVLGLGCAGCQQFYEQVLAILAARGLPAELQYLTDPGLFQEYDVRTFPALVVNGRVVVAGRVPPPAELEKLLLKAAGPPEEAKDAAQPH
jgi:hypothetical protein